MRILVIFSSVALVAIAGPVKKPDCSTVRCAYQTCPGVYLPKGECCPKCPDCSLTFCPAIVCLGGYVPEGQCCQTCPDCTTVKCGLPDDCKDHYTPEGDCCATCPGVITEPDCSTVRCMKPKCPNSFQHPGQCCESCPGEFPGRRCRYNGKTYFSGQTFTDIDGCNTCFCDDGIISCTDRDCTYVPRPGQCPVSTGVGPCVQECFRDHECPGNDDKCCKNGCGYVCLKPVLEGPMPCLYNGVLYQSGQSVPSNDCNECTCQEGRISCTEKACPEVCQHGSAGVCGGKMGLRCPEYSTCTGLDPNVIDGTGECCYDVLCPYGKPDYPEGTCGTIVGLSCELPNTECRGMGDYPDAGGSCCYIKPPVDCSLVDCLPTTCENPRKPEPWECCETCPSDEGPDCSAVSCLKPVCKPGEGPQVPEGQCCPVCVRKVPDCSNVVCPLLKCKENQKLYTPKGKCCPKCVPKALGRPCWHNGVRYNSGDSVPADDDCNRCHCDEGVVRCTEIACEKPCPYGTTGVKCSKDSPCATPNTECRQVDPLSGVGVCCYIYDPTIVKPGKCPPPPIEVGICVITDTHCSSDMACAGNLKCCPNGCGRECLEPIPPTACVYNGVTYNDGDSFPSTDGCNTCTCSNGVVGCTKRACLGCTYGDVTYSSGESFPAGDGCNTCSCSDGRILCTLIACPACVYNGVTYNDGDSFPSTDGCNTCTCSNGVVGCTKRACLGCTYGDVTYSSGESFPAGDGCNTCSCSDGRILCTLIACPAPKDGECPDPGIGTCDERCSNDQDCKGIQKCCSNGCGHACMIPKNSCLYNGQYYLPDSSFPSTDGCNECFCSSEGGLVACTERACMSEQTAMCTDNEGQIHEAGGKWTDSDGSQCTCTETGDVECVPVIINN